MNFNFKHFETRNFGPVDPKRHQKRYKKNLRIYLIHFQLILTNFDYKNHAVPSPLIPKLLPRPYQTSEASIRHKSQTKMYENSPKHSALLLRILRVLGYINISQIFSFFHKVLQIQLNNIWVGNLFKYFASIHKCNFHFSKLSSFWLFILNINHSEGGGVSKKRFFLSLLFCVLIEICEQMMWFWLVGQTDIRIRR